MSTPALPATLTHREARAALAALRAALATEPAPAVRVDASALARFDSSALALLLALRRSAERGGKTLRIIGLPAHVRELAALYGIDALLAEAPTQEGHR